MVGKGQARHFQRAGTRIRLDLVERDLFQAGPLITQGVADGIRQFLQHGVTS
jgi:hypothetical protein